MFQKIARAGQTTQVLSNILGQAVAVGGGTVATVGGWVEVGRTTLGSAGDSIDVTSLPDKQYYMILRFIISSGNTVVYNKLNDDGGTNYASRASENGGTDGTSTEDTSVIYDTGGDAGDKFDITYISNIAGKEKLALGQQNNEDASGAGNAPVRGEFAWKWSNTSDPIDQIETLNTGQSGNYDTGSEVVVLGWDPDDTHTLDDNFWEELASQDIETGSQMTANFTAKKYLWIQFYFITSSTSNELFFNNDQQDNYARRYSNNFGNDVTTVDIPAITTNFGFDTLPHFGNMFVVNNTNQEKLVIANFNMQNTATAGTAPQDTQLASKWANTSAQITRFDIKSTGTFSKCICKVWGHD